MPFLSAEESHELHSCVNTCVEWWKAAGPESCKQMFALFAISGIFVATCCHGHILVLCDMTHSSESRMKYPLAVINNLIDRFGEDLGVAYDIMCAFFKTLLHSAKLRDKVIDNRLVGVVPAFHGHAHNHKCQVEWHPQYINSIGLEDFEECERMFSLSNNLASTTRLTMEFHRRQAIQEHFKFHDEDKHAASGNFIYQNYRQALDRLLKDGPLLEEICEQRGISCDDCEQFLASERDYFNTEFEDPLELTIKMDYAELLQKLWAAKVQSDDAHLKFQSLQRDEGKNLSEKEKSWIEVRNRTTHQFYEIIEEEVADFEVEHGIVKRWKEKKLEQLVVQRLFELTKMNSSELCYRQHTKISDGLKARSGAIRTALDNFNKIAQRIGRSQLDFDEIFKMVTLAEFDVLKNSHIDISTLAWTKPENRKLMRLHFGVKHAEEEIRGLNVEIRHLITFMINNHADFVVAIRACGDEGLATELKRRLSYQLVVHRCIAERLVQTSRLSGFTGTLLPGQRISRNKSINDSVPLPEWAAEVLHLRKNSSSTTEEPIVLESYQDADDKGEGSLYSDQLSTFFEHLVLHEDDVE
ncbi:hypothetical protein Moror_9522 [Moniliophthora roreri MCA 2997]|uniref:Uncharacterized protein n=1 Tax=Moniliophthora roreri (strain MCA 2997) TaxID=1381753 RepID=V2XBT0_MONRO|nr:hypothetical protein Moror_9522 [Moniliophthora roreri MCA 2997]